MEEEKEKNKKNITNDSSTIGDASSDTKREWKQVVGGFVPNILKRDAPYPPVQNVDTLEDYKRIVVDEQDAIVVVRFFAPWCKSCKSAHPLFKKMVSEHASSPVKFVEVPLTKDTAYIHEGLGVPSVPFGHIYHPEVGLVEEKKINKKVFKEFREALDCYVRGSCDIPIEEGEDVGEESDGGFQ
jgi:thiol-disulfide isomerase/thioredoxin